MGNPFRALNIFFKNDIDPWIIDSGVSDHMTSNSSLFVSYIPCSGQQKVKIADGSYATILGKGTIKLSGTLVLYSVLHVPKLSVNLLSISKLSRDLNYIAVFSTSKCVFQDQTSMKTIGFTRLEDGLYYLNKDNQGFPRSYHGTRNMNKEEVIWLWHYRLGHLSFARLKSLMPNLFVDCNVTTFQCEVCTLAKHHRISYPLSNFKSIVPLSVIHSDVWGPSRISNLGGKRWFVTFIDEYTRLTWVYLMRDKSDVYQIFVNFYN